MLFSRYINSNKLTVFACCITQKLYDQILAKLRMDDYDNEKPGQVFQQKQLILRFTHLEYTNCN